jgi:hypothetical protein
MKELTTWLSHLIEHLVKAIHWHDWGEWKEFSSYGYSVFMERHCRACGWRQRKRVNCSDRGR